MSPRQTYRTGILDGLPFLLVIIPFGLLFGVVATEAGLSLANTMVMTMAVIAGASQFTALQMMSDGAGITMIVLASLAVNLRMAMYSASLVPHLGAAPMWQRALVSYAMVDQAYAVAATKFERVDWSVQAKVAYYFGVATPIVPAWGLMTLVGALVGSTIPESWGLDFVLPITFISLVGPLLRTLPHILAATASVIAGLLLAGLPSGFGLLIAAFIAMCVGAVTESFMEEKSA